MKICDWIKQSSKKLSHINNCKFDLEILLSFVIKKDKIWISMYDDFCLSIDQINTLESFLLRRSRGEPLAYILKNQEFWTLLLSVSKDTFIPRKDTELLIEVCLSILDKFNYNRILDLGSGSGSISLSIAKTKPDCHVVGVDYKREIISVSQYNAKKLNISNVDFYVSNWFSSLYMMMFDIIVSNPPYISLNEFLLIREELKYEPITSLVSYNNGFGDIKYIIKNSIQYLNPQGWLLLEHGYNQACMVKSFFEQFNYVNIITYQDYGNNDRITIGQKR
ncbi:MAG: peptide chain release factor N(5)-glutamine methyltransferase [Buchnera aphidicola (Eriosoma harunire)]